MEHKELRLRLQGEIYRAVANKDGQQEGFNPILYNAFTYTHTLSGLGNLILNPYAKQP